MVTKVRGHTQVCGRQFSVRLETGQTEVYTCHWLKVWGTSTSMTKWFRSLIDAGRWPPGADE